LVKIRSDIICSDSKFIELYIVAIHIVTLHVVSVHIVTLY